MENNLEKEEYSKKQRELFIKKASHMSMSYLERVKNLKHTPKEMQPFFDNLKRIFVEMEDVEKKSGKISIGTYCAMVPEELIYALNAVPIRLCSGNYTAYQIGDDYVPRDACPLVKSLEGFGKIKTMPIYDNCAMMVVPITCDCKKKIAGMLKEIKPIVLLQVPYVKEREGAAEFYIKQIYNLIENLEKVTGRKITEETLEQAIYKTEYAKYELSCFQEYRKQQPFLLYGSQVMAIMNAYAYMDAEIWANHMRELNNKLRERLRQGSFIGKENQPRILVTGSPIVFPNLKIPLLIEEMGGILVADETCMGERGISDPVVVNDRSFTSMIRALANRYLRPCTCPVFTDNSQRIYRLKQLVKEYKVQGIVYHVLRGCLVYDYEYSIIEEVFGTMDIPVIRVESDYNEEDVEQLRIRMEAFIEMIKLKSYNIN